MRSFNIQGVFIAESDLDEVRGFCYQREDGTFTRLIPADLLPEINKIPARLVSHEGLMVLPMPRMAGVEDQPADGELTPQSWVTPPRSPQDQDVVQSHIDAIVANTSSTSGPVVLARGGTRMAIGGKKEKIYCDKWIHDGVCAFTQQGCKYKHEMPHDRETQMSLGLFHGHPTWWKRRIAELQMPIDDSPIALPQITSGDVGGGAGSYGSASGSVGHSGSGAGSGYGGGSRPCGGFDPRGGGGALSWRRTEASPVAQPFGPAGFDTASTYAGRARGSGRGGLGRGGLGRTVARFNQQQGNFGPIAPPAKFDQRADQSKAAHCSVSADSSKDEIIGFGGARCGIGRDNGVPLNPFAALEDFGEGGSNKTKDADDAYEDDANKDLD